MSIEKLRSIRSKLEALARLQHEVQEEMYQLAASNDWQDIQNELMPVHPLAKIFSAMSMRISHPDPDSGLSVDGLGVRNVYVKPGEALVLGEPESGSR